MPFLSCQSPAISLFLLAFLFPVLVSGQLIPENRRTDWSKAGNFSELRPETIVNVIDFGAKGNGVDDDFSSVEAAVASLHNGGVVEFPEGIYLLKSPIHFKDNIIFRGKSAGRTKLLFNLSGAEVNCIDISKEQNHAFVPLVGGITKGSDSLVLSTSSGFQVDDFVEIRQQNGSWDTHPANWAKHCIGQISRVTAVNGNIVKLEDQLRINMDLALQPEIRVINPIIHAGMECIAVERKDSAASGFNISFRYAVNCLIKGIESSKSAGAHILAHASAHLEVRDSYFHHAFSYDGGSTRGYGVALIQHSSDCLIENNIFQHLRHSMMVKQGANGNVFAYNYSFDPFRSEFPSNAGGDISLHGHFPYANLFEGNIVQTIHIDQAWGPSGPFNTFFRNRAELYGILMTEGAVNSDSQNFVANEITNSGFLMGNYSLAGSDHFAFGNNAKGTIIPENTNSVPDKSYYLESTPDFWNASFSWPSVGIPNTLGSGTIPAKSMYDTGFISFCEPLITSSGESLSFNATVFPNPFSDVLEIKIVAATPLLVFVKDLLGKPLYSEQVSSGTTVLRYENWPSGYGIFFVEIKAGRDRKIYKIIKAE